MDGTEDLVGGASPQEEYRKLLRGIMNKHIELYGSNWPIAVFGDVLKEYVRAYHGIHAAEPFRPPVFLKDLKGLP